MIVIQDTWDDEDDMELYEYFEKNNIKFEIKTKTGTTSGCARRQIFQP